MCHDLSLLMPERIQVPEYLPMSTSTSTITLGVMSAPYSSTASMSTEYPSPAANQMNI